MTDPINVAASNQLALLASRFLENREACDRAAAHDALRFVRTNKPEDRDQAAIWIMKRDIWQEAHSQVLKAMCGELRP